MSFHDEQFYPYDLTPQGDDDLIDIYDEALMFVYDAEHMAANQHFHHKYDRHCLSAGVLPVGISERYDKWCLEAAILSVEEAFNADVLGIKTE